MVQTQPNWIINGVSVSRTMVSMAKFLHSLRALAKPTCYKFSTGQRSDKNLKCFSEYKVGVAETRISILPLHDFRDFFFRLPYDSHILLWSNVISSNFTSDGMVWIAAKSQSLTCQNWSTGPSQTKFLWIYVGIGTGRRGEAVSSWKTTSQV